MGNGIVLAPYRSGTRRNAMELIAARDIPKSEGAGKLLV